MSLPGGIEKVDRILQGKGLSYKTFSLEPPIEGVDVTRKFNKIVRKCSRIDPESRPSPEYLIQVLRRLSEDVENRKPATATSPIHKLIRHVSSMNSSREMMMEQEEKKQG